MANEKRLIDANALKSQITRYHMSLTPRYISKLVDAEIGDVIDIIDETPTVDAVEVVHGYWVATPVRKLNSKGKVVNYCDYYHCSECGTDRPIVPPYNYCPNCGAKMDGDGNA